MLTYRGRRTGRTYRTPVAVGRTADGFVIPIPFGDDTQWPKNVLADGTARMRWAGREYELTAPEIVDKDTAAPAFGGFAGMALGSVPIERFLRLREATPA
jgi:deazaflavin-dependent oxidoreductase (nitroreductase family)